MSAANDNWQFQLWIKCQVSFHGQNLQTIIWVASMKWIHGILLGNNTRSSCGDVYSWNVNVFGNMGVDMRWIRSATGIKAQVMGNLPIKGELIVDPMDSKVVIKYDPPTQRMHVITAKVEPMNVVWYTPSSMERLPWTYEAVVIQSRENARTWVFEVSNTSTTLGLNAVLSNILSASQYIQTYLLT